MAEFLSAVGGAAVAGIVAVVLALVRGRREDEIRKEERAHAKEVRIEERSRADTLRKEELANADRRVREERDFAIRLKELDYHRESEKELRTQGVAEARTILAELNSLRTEFLAESVEWGTHNYNGEVTRAVENGVLLLPDSELRAIVTLGMRVINGVWVGHAVGDLEDSGHLLQRQVLDEVISAVSAYINDEAIDPTLVPGYKSTQKLLDESFETFERTETRPTTKPTSK